MCPFLFNCEDLIGIGRSLLFHSFLVPPLSVTEQRLYYCWMKEESDFDPQVSEGPSDNESSEWLGVDTKLAHSGPHSMVLSRWKSLSSSSRLPHDRWILWVLPACPSRWSTTEVHCGIWGSRHPYSLKSSKKHPGETQDVSLEERSGPESVW